MPEKRSGDGASQSTWQSSWQYFVSLYFLKDQFTVRSSTGNMPDVGHDNIVHEDNTHSGVFESNMQDVDDSINVNQPPLPEETIEANASTHNNKGLKRKRQNDADIGTALIRIEENKLRVLEKQHQKTTDEDLSFFESLLPHIRTLTPQKKMLLRIKMQELVYNFVYVNQPNRLPNQYVIIPGDPEAQNISQAYQCVVNNRSQLTELPTMTQEYSNPTSVASYLSSFSDDTNQNI